MTWPCQVGVYRWYNTFKYGRKSAESMGGSGIPITALTKQRIHTGATVILDNSHLTARQLDLWLDISIGSAHTLLSTKLGFSRVYAQRHRDILLKNLKRVTTLVKVHKEFRKINNPSTAPTLTRDHKEKPTLAYVPHCAILVFLIFLYSPSFTHRICPSSSRNFSSNYRNFCNIFSELSLRLPWYLLRIFLTKKKKNRKLITVKLRDWSHMIENMWSDRKIDFWRQINGPSLMIGFWSESLCRREAAYYWHIPCK